MKKRVLILSASAGNGHVRAGAALEEAFAAEPEVEQAVHHDSLKYTNKLFRDAYSKLYTQLVTKAPTLLGYLYRTSDEPWKDDRARRLFERLNTGPLVKLIREFDPHFTVCTHFLPASIIAHLIGQGTLQAHLSIVVTDLDCHAMWLSPVFHRYFVALEETSVYLQSLGLPAERITVAGIPIDLRFGQPIDRAAVAAAHRLDPALPIILLSAGALAVSPAELIVDSMQEQLRTPAQVVVICGRDEGLRGRLLAKLGENHPRFRILGFTDRMFELMQLADLFIGKPGGLTTAEALACGLPMAIIQPIPGQEERNSDHLLEEGAAIRCNELATLPYKVDRLLQDGPRLAAMGQRAGALGFPHAARTIARTLLADASEPLRLDARTLRKRNSG